jgi:hypothetical protein
MLVTGFDDLVDRRKEGVVVFEPSLDIRQMSDSLFLTRWNELGKGPLPIDQEDHLPVLSHFLHEIREVLLRFRDTETGHGTLLRIMIPSLRFTVSPSGPIRRMRG